MAHKPKIAVFTLTYNEIMMVPFFLANYRKCDIFVIDGGSTDGTVDELRRNGAHVEVRQSESLDDAELLAIRNTEHRRARGLYDWTIVVDFDEFLHDDEIGLHARLASYTDYDACRLRPYMMVGPEVAPRWTGRPLTELVKYGFRDPWSDKMACFRSSIDIEYGIGCHQFRSSCDPKRVSPPQIMMLHYQMMGLDVLLERSRCIASRLSQRNQQNNWGVHRREYSDESKCIVAWDECRRKSFRVLE